MSKDHPDKSGLGAHAAEAIPIAKAMPRKNSHPAVARTRLTEQARHVRLVFIRIVAYSCADR